MHTGLLNPAEVGNCRAVALLKPVAEIKAMQQSTYSVENRDAKCIGESEEIVLDAMQVRMLVSDLL